MTWYWINDGEGTISVWDHNGDLITSERDHSGWAEDGYPTEVLEVMREAADESKPSGYGQALLIDAATNNIKKGRP